MKKNKPLILIAIFIAIIIGAAIFLLKSGNHNLISGTLGVSDISKPNDFIPPMPKPLVDPYDWQVGSAKEGYAINFAQIKNQISEIKVGKIKAADIKNTVVVKKGEATVKAGPKIVTEIVFGNSDLQFRQARINLKKTGPVNAIITCRNWLENENDCAGSWELADDIAFTQDANNLSFSVSHFSAYAGVYLEIVNVQSNLTQGDDWTVIFKTYGQSDLKIEAVDGTNYGIDLEFKNISCGSNQIPASDIETDGNIIIVRNYQCNEASNIRNKTITAGRHWLAFTFGDTIDEKAHNFACTTGTLDDTCTVSSTQNMNNNDVISGSGSLVIASGGNIAAAVENRIAITMTGDITIQSGGTLTANATTTSNNFTIDSGGSINLNAKGYAGGGGWTAGYGPGGGGSSGGGGGYGGIGGGAGGGTAYGSSTAPTNFGSGGGGAGGTSGKGGGAIKLIVQSALTVNGNITVIGGNGTAGSYGAGGGAGGSIWISTDTLAGSAIISAAGGNGGNYMGYGGGGSGGRIAIYYTTKTYTGLIVAPGGRGVAPASRAGSIIEFYGTVYDSFKFSSGTENFSGIYTNATVTGTSSSLTLNLDSTFTNFTVATSATTTIASSITLTSDVINLNTSGTLSNQGTLTNNTSMTLSGGWYIQSGTADINSSGATMTVSGGTVNWDIATTTTNIPTFSSVTIASGATLTHSANVSTTTQGYLIILASAGDMHIDGTINVNAKGYAGGGGWAAGYGPGGGSGSGGGGGHGGTGGGASGGLANGSLVAPIDIGSGGGGAGGTSGKGAGAVRLIAQGTLTVDGAISSTGSNGTAGSYGAGGGSGGSVWIYANTLAGSAAISATGGNGGNYAGYGGGGSGGRIAIYYVSKTYNGSVTASGGTGRAPASSAGTAYWQTLASNPPTSTIVSPANNSVVGTVSINGTAVTGANSIEKIEISIRKDLGDYYYNGSTFVASTSVVWLDASGTTSWNYAIADSVFSNVKHWLTVRAKDTLGGYEEPKENTFTFAYPYSTITSPANNSIASSSAFTGTAGTNPAGGTAAEVNISIKDNIANKYYNGSGFTEDTEQWLPVSGASSWTYDISGIPFVPGKEYKIRSRAEDNYGVLEVSGAGVSFIYFAGLVISANTNWTTNQTIDTDGFLITNNATLTIDDNVTVNNSGPVVFNNVTSGRIILSGANTVLNGTNFMVNLGTAVFDVNKDIVTAPSFSFIKVSSGAILAHTANTTTHTYSLIASSTGNMEVNGTINVNGKGYAGGGGWAAGYGSGGGGSGGGGGYGGAGGGSGGGAAYGSLTAPTDLGSGGGGASSSGGAGGGAIKLIVLGTLTINGNITAAGSNGSSAGEYGSGAGSGGSIWIDADTLAGTAVISVAGGNGGNYAGWGSAAGGGRIALYYTTKTYIGSVIAPGGTTGIAPASSAGSIIEFYGTGNDSFKFSSGTDNFSGTYTNATVTGTSSSLTLNVSSTFTNLNVATSASLTIANGVTLNSNVINLNTSGALSNQGILNNNTSMTFYGGRYVQSASADINSSGATMAVSAGTATWDIAKDATNIPTFSSVTISGGATLTQTANTSTTTHIYSLILSSAGNMRIDGTINVNAKGYAGSSGWITGYGPGAGGGSGGGGGYGGAGGGSGGGITYGSSVAPVDIGSGGGGAGATGGRGGGAIRLIVQGTLTVDGAISSTGGNGTAGSYGAGGGSGGSIWITANKLAGSAAISAGGGNGGNYAGYGGSGGGGRIAIYYVTETYNGSVTAPIGTGVAPAASAGTTNEDTYTTNTAAARGKVKFRGNVKIK